MSCSKSTYISQTGCRKHAVLPAIAVERGERWWECFQGAINHSRAPQPLLLKMIDELNASSYKGKSFEDILAYVTKRTDGLQGFGPLTFYDISSGISRWNDIPIHRVYIVGGGPIDAAELLHLHLKKFRVGNRVFNYAERKDVLEALDMKNVVINIPETMDGDALETFLCIWQKKVE